MTPEERIEATLAVAYESSQVDGSHHKAWAIDQMVRILLGENYDHWIHEYKFGDSPSLEAIEEGEYYEWDTGIAP